MSATLIIVFIGILVSITTEAVATNNDSKDREYERMAISWWPYNTSEKDHCEWNGITCDDGGRVAEMRIEGCNKSNTWLRRLDYLDVVAFPYLNRLHLSRTCGLYGEIPVQIGYVAGAQLLSLNLSGNNLSGGVPASLSNLRSLDLSDNHLDGLIPFKVWERFTRRSFLGNSKLVVPGDSNSSSRVFPEAPGDSNSSSRVFPEALEKARKLNVVKNFLPVGLFFFCSIFCGFMVCCLKRKKTSTVMPDPKHGDIFKIWNYDGKIAYEDVVESIADFDLRYCIGTGGYGSVYRAELPSGRVVAVKKLHKFEGENPIYDKCFRNEAKVLSETRHRNIVKLFGFCLHNRCF